MPFALSPKEKDFILQSCHKALTWASVQPEPELETLMDMPADRFDLKKGEVETIQGLARKIRKDR
ncbi:MAG: hypothetical protein KKB20_28970 [Proteobacteria bacterium]|nr:hypothetical protein [Pseudomonadota bacterium]